MDEAAADVVMRFPFSDDRGMVVSLYDRRMLASSMSGRKLRYFSGRSACSVRRVFDDTVAMGAPASTYWPWDTRREVIAPEVVADAVPDAACPL